MIDLVGGGAGMLDFTRDLGSGEGEGYEKIMVRHDVRNSFIVKVLYLYKNYR